MGVQAGGCGPVCEGFLQGGPGFPLAEGWLSWGPVALSDGVLGPADPGGREQLPADLRGEQDAAQERLLVEFQVGQLGDDAEQFGQFNRPLRRPDLDDEVAQR